MKSITHTISLALFCAVIPVSGAPILTSLHGFSGGINDGALPSADMILGRDGNFYGTTEGNGISGDQVIFRA